MKRRTIIFVMTLALLFTLSMGTTIYLSIFHVGGILSCGFEDGIDDWTLKAKAAMTTEKACSGKYSVKLSEQYLAYDGTNIAQMFDYQPFLRKKLHSNLLTVYKAEPNYEYEVTYTFQYNVFYGVLSKTGEELKDCFPIITARLDWGDYSGPSGAYEYWSGLGNGAGIVSPYEGKRHRPVYMEHIWYGYDDYHPLPADAIVYEKDERHGWALIDGTIDYYPSWFDKPSFQWNTESFSFKISDPHKLTDKDYLTLSFFIDPVQTEEHFNGHWYFDGKNRMQYDVNRLDSYSAMLNYIGVGGISASTEDWIVFADTLTKIPNGATIFAYIDDVSISADVVSKNIATNTTVQTHTLQIESTEGGVTTPAQGTYVYNLGQTITIRTQSTTRYFFAYWVVDGDAVKTELLSLTMDSDHKVRAVFMSIDEIRAPSQPWYYQYFNLLILLIIGVFVVIFVIYKLKRKKG